MADEPNHPHDPPLAKPSLPYLNYTKEPPPRPPEGPLATVLQMVSGFAFYWSLIVVMKLASNRFHWEIGAICGMWVCVLVIAFGVGGWLAGALGWHGALYGVVIGFVLSLLGSAIILRDG